MYKFEKSLDIYAKSGIIQECEKSVRDFVPDNIKIWQLFTLLN